MVNRLHVRQIIPFSYVDGPGNRCAIFLQGCNASCIYCHNPETIPLEVEHGASWMTVDEMVGKIEIYRPFIRGITVSGGEPTLQWQAIAELFEKVKPLKLDCLVDTNGFFDIQQIKPLIDGADGFLFDVKSLKDNERLCAVAGVSALNQLNYLLQLGKIEEVRTVIISDYMDALQTVEAVAKCLLPYPHVTYRLIRMHVKGMEKSRITQLAPYIPSQNEMAFLQEAVRRIGHNNVLCVL